MFFSVFVFERGPPLGGSQRSAGGVREAEKSGRKLHAVVRTNCVMPPLGQHPRIHEIRSDARLRISWIRGCCPRGCMACVAI